MPKKIDLTITVDHPLTVEYVPLSALTEYPDNPHKGDVAAIKASLLKSRQYKAIVASRRTSYVLAGNHTLRAMRELDVEDPTGAWGQIAVTFLDNLSPEAEKRILAADNRIQDLATYEDEKLLALLSELADLEGTGYTPEDVEDLRFVLEGMQDIEYPTTDAHMNETAEQEAAREAQIGAYTSLKEKGLAELILVMPADQKIHALTWCERLRSEWGKELTNGDIVYRALDAAMRQLG